MEFKSSHKISHGFLFKTTLPKIAIWLCVTWLCVTWMGYMPAVMADACIIEGGSPSLQIKMCQTNVSVPSQLFTDEFCQPKLKDMTFKVSQVKSCPTGAFGTCENSQIPGSPYLQHISYYSVPSDQPILKAACEGQSKGQWQSGTPLKP